LPEPHMIRFLIKAVVIAVVVVLVLPFVAIVGLGLLGGKGTEAGGGDPGKARYDEMNQTINAYHDVEAFGNTPDAQAIAQAFATAMKELRAESFTKGKEGALSLSQGHFITYCHADQKSIVLLCHVPEFRRFQDDAKAALMQMAWTVAQAASATKDAQPRQLVVGLRGIALYYQFWFGSTSGKPKYQRDSTDGRKALYEMLAPPKAAPATPAPTPAPKEPPPTPPVEAKPSAAVQLGSRLRV
jgi:hypothetical protein